MDISQSRDIVTLSSQLIPGYRYIHIIQNVKTIGTTIAQETFTDSTSTYTFTKDGYFILTEIKLPTVPGAYYYIDEDTVYDPSGLEITVEDLLDVNTTGTNIIREDNNYLTTYILGEHYLTLIKSKFNKDLCGCGCGCIEKQDKIHLDTLTMGLDLLNALEERLLYNEAQRIVEGLASCLNLIETNCNCR